MRLQVDHGSDLNNAETREKVGIGEKALSNFIIAFSKLEGSSFLI